MDKISFRTVPHTARPGVEVLEILLNGKMVAAIYPDAAVPKSIKIVSAHFGGDLTQGNRFPDGVKMDTGERVSPPIPAVHITFDPRRYRMTPTGIDRSS